MLARVLSLDTSWYSLSWCTHEYHEIIKNICQLTLLKLPEASEAEKSEPLLKAVEGKNRVCPSHERHGALPAGSAPIPPKKKHLYMVYILQIKSQPPATKWCFKMFSVDKLLLCRYLGVLSRVLQLVLRFLGPWATHEIRTLNIPGPVGITPHSGRSRF
jgi:hypothetical protein